MVESANKLVVEARLKGAGMHWQRGHVDAMLALRNLLCNAAQRAQYVALHPEWLADLKPAHQPAPPPPPTPKSAKPARDHPWRRSPIGKARFK